MSPSHRGPASASSSSTRPRLPGAPSPASPASRCRRRAASPTSRALTSPSHTPTSTNPAGASGGATSASPEADGPCDSPGGASGRSPRSFLRCAALAPLDMPLKCDAARPSSSTPAKPSCPGRGALRLGFRGGLPVPSVIASGLPVPSVIASGLPVPLPAVGGASSRPGSSPPCRSSTSVTASPLLLSPLCLSPLCLSPLCLSPRSLPTFSICRCAGSSSSSSLGPLRRSVFFFRAIADGKFGDEFISLFQSRPLDLPPRLSGRRAWTPTRPEARGHARPAGLRPVGGAPRARLHVRKAANGAGDTRLRRTVAAAHLAVAARRASRARLPPPLRLSLLLGARHAATPRCAPSADGGQCAPLRRRHRLR
eukprot:scaffold114565_cov63-Phaeocystis_antarctica.AAC.2